MLYCMIKTQAVSVSGHSYRLVAAEAAYTDRNRETKSTAVAEFEKSKFIYSHP